MDPISGAFHSVVLFLVPVSAVVSISFVWREFVFGGVVQTILLGLFAIGLSIASLVQTKK